MFVFMFRTTFVNYFFCKYISFVDNFQNLFGFNDFQNIQKMKTTSPLPGIYYECPHINPFGAKPNKDELGDTQ